MREDLGPRPYSLRQAFDDLRWLKEKRRGARGIEATRLDDSISAQRQVVVSLFRAHNNRRRQG